MNPLHVTDKHSMGMKNWIETQGVSIKKVEISGPFDGIPESHQDFHDAYLVIQGKATVYTASYLEGYREVAQGEFREGELVNPQEFSLSGGDLFFIPAGVAHALKVHAGSYIQWVVKIPK